MALFFGGGSRAACRFFRTWPVPLLMCLVFASPVYAQGGGTPGAFGQAMFDDSLIRSAPGCLFKLVEGAFGALIFVLAMLTAIVCFLFRRWRWGIICCAIGGGAFVARSLISHFFGTGFVEYQGELVRPYEVYNNGAGCVPAYCAIPFLALCVAVCMSYLWKIFWPKSNRASLKLQSGIAIIFLTLVFWHARIALAQGGGTQKGPTTFDDTLIPRSVGSLERLILNASVPGIAYLAILVSVAAGCYKAYRVAGCCIVVAIAALAFAILR